MNTTVDGQDEAISVAQALREAEGKISYQQLRGAMKRGQIEVVQPGGKGGHYRLKRTDLEALLKPLNHQDAPEPAQTAQ